MLIWVLDIQEYYELTLLNDTKSVQQKMQETMEIVSKWDIEPPIISNQMKTSSSVCSLPSYCTDFKSIAGVKVNIIQALNASVFSQNFIFAILVLDGD